jgi:hypothetical protein
VDARRALSSGCAHPENLRAASASVNLTFRSSSVSRFGGWTGNPSAVSEIPSLRAHGDGVSVVVADGSVVIPCSC